MFSIRVGDSLANLDDFVNFTNLWSVGNLPGILSTIHNTHTRSHKEPGFVSPLQISSADFLSTYRSALHARDEDLPVEYTDEQARVPVE